MTWSAYESADTLIAGATLNALADGGWATGAEINNTTAKHVLMDVVLDLPSAVTPVGEAARLDIYLLVDTAPGGTAEYPTSRADVAADTPATYKVGSISAMAVASGFVRGVLRGVEIPPGKYKLQIENNLGVAFPSSDGARCEGFRYSPA